MFTHLTEAPLSLSIAVFVLSAFVIAVSGSKIARVADRLADETGWGEAMLGAVLLGAGTSLPGTVTSVTAAAEGHADLAFTNAMGGIAAQTAFLAVADLFYLRANLEHAAASVSNMMQGTLLIILLAMTVSIMSAPPIDFFHIHPGSLVLLLVYIVGIRMIHRSRGASTWEAAQTPETVVDTPENRRPASRGELRNLWIRFLVHGLLLATAGFFVAQSGIAISEKTFLSETVIGTFFTAIATSLPELATSVAAVRQGALTLAVGNVIGGNSFEVLFLPLSDIAYREGSIYHALGYRQIFVISLALLLNAVILLGLLRREKHGIGNIGFESFLVFVLYILGFVILFYFPEAYSG